VKNELGAILKELNSGAACRKLNSASILPPISEEKQSNVWNEDLEIMVERG